MRTENIDIIGVDLGYDSIKMLTDEKKIIFPSLAEEEEEGVLSDTSFKVIKKNSKSTKKFDPEKIIIQLKNETIDGLSKKGFTIYKVGNYVLNQSSSSIGYSLSDKKYEEPEEFAKLLSGICLLFPKADQINIKNLITGLPIKYYENHKKSFKNKLESNFEIKLKTIDNEFIKRKVSIQKATIIPQGLASYYDFIMDKKGLVTKNIEGGFGIVDIGGLTIDCVAFNNGELIKGSPISFNDGVRTKIFKKIQDSLDIDISQDIIKKQILDDKNYIKVRNEKYEFTEVKEKAIDKLTKDISLQIKNRWESYLMIDKILITGGATLLLFDSLDAYLKRFPCERINKDPQFSNCRGYMKLGKALKRKREAELKEKIKERKLKPMKKEIAVSKEN